MLAIGRALMSKPKLLLIDEASLGLSPALAKTVFQVVKRINQDGVTVIIVEQNVGVLPYADRALIMEKGTLIFSGVGDEIQNANLRESYLGKAPSAHHEEGAAMKIRWDKLGGLLGIVYCLVGPLPDLPRLERGGELRPRARADPVPHLRRDRRAGARRRRLRAHGGAEPADGPGGATSRHRGPAGLGRAQRGRRWRRRHGTGRGRSGHGTGRRGGWVAGPADGRGWNRGRWADELPPPRLQPLGGADRRDRHLAGRGHGQRSGSLPRAANRPTRPSPPPKPPRGLRRAARGGGESTTRGVTSSSGR